MHDMGWPERPVFGKIRFMNYAGCKRKFDVAAFEARYSGAGSGQPKLQFPGAGAGAAGDGAVAVASGKGKKGAVKAGSKRGSVQTTLDAKRSRKGES